MKTRQDNNKIIIQVQSMLKTILNYGDLYDYVGSMWNTKQDNDMTDCIGVVYAKTETELLGPIEPSVVCYQNQKG